MVTGRVHGDGAVIYETFCQDLGVKGKHRTLPVSDGEGQNSWQIFSSNLPPTRLYQIGRFGRLMLSSVINSPGKLDGQDDPKSAGCQFSLTKTLKM